MNASISAGGLDSKMELEALTSPVPRTSPEFLAAALGQAGVGTWQVDMLSGLFTWDAVTSSILGLPFIRSAAGEMLPIHADDRAEVWERLVNPVVDGVTDETEFRILRPDGEIRWVRATGRQLDAPLAERRHVAGIVTDVTERRAAADDLKAAEERYRLVSQVTSDLIFDWDIANDQLQWNEAKGAFLGYSAADIGSMSVLRFKIHPDDRDRVVAEFADVFGGDAAEYTSDHRFEKSGGGYSDVHACGIVIRNIDGRPVRMVGSIQDVTERRYADVALRESEAINRGIVEASTDSVVLLDLEGRLLFLNRSGGLTTTGQDLAKHYGRHWTAIWPGHARPALDQAVRHAAAGQTSQVTASFAHESQTRWWEINVSPIRDDEGEPIKLVAIARDITQRREADEKLLKAATSDGLTNLANRTCFQDRLAVAVDRAVSSKSRLGLLLLDVDDFKQVNDSLGHDAGDALLASIASRLEIASDRAQIVARLGGDEFAVLLEGIEEENELSAHAEAILQRMTTPITYGRAMLDCRVSVGAALFPEHGTSPDELLKSADIALYLAKASTRGALTVFEPRHRDGLRGRAAMITAARSALQQRRIVPFYQSKVRLADGAIMGFEALLRLRHPTQGILLPATISAAFEDPEVAAAMSQTMISQVIADMRGWLDQGLPFGHVAVNAAAAEFRGGRFAEDLLERLQAAAVPTCYFQLEVTETVFLGKGAEYVDRALKLLNSEGIRIALDDFGTGYASLRHLKQFPVDVMKIDRGFVQAMESNAEDAAIISAVVNLGRSLDIDVVAEGIETIEQAKHLQKLGCKFGQGFLFTEAVPCDAVSALLVPDHHARSLN